MLSSNSMILRKHKKFWLSWISFVPRTLASYWTSERFHFLLYKLKNYDLKYWCNESNDIKINKELCA